MFRGEQKILFELIKAIAASQGLKGFWKGNFVNILYTAPFKAANFYAYDTYRNHLLRMSGNEEITNFERFLAGAIAGITATVLCIPMDTIQFMLFLLFVSQLLTELVGGRQIYQNVKGQRRLLFDVIVILFGYVIIFLRSTRVFSFLHFQRSIVDQDEDGSTWWGSIGWCDWCFPLHDPK